MTVDHRTGRTRRTRGTRGTARTRVGATLGVAVVLGVTAACSSPPGPEDQRDDVLAIAEHVRAQLEAEGMRDVELADDGTEPLPCSEEGGERYRQLVVGAVDLSEATYFDVDEDDADALADSRLDQVGRVVSGAVATNPVRPDFFNRGSGPDTDDPGPRQEVYRSDEGDSSGASLTVDLVPLDGGLVEVRLEATTVCA